MAIFYTDTGSFNRLEVTGSAIVSGSLIVSGGIAGDTSVFFNDGLTVTGSTILSGSLIISGNANFGPSVIADTIFVDSMIVQNNIDITNGTINTSLSNTPNPLGARVVVQDEGSGQLYITASILPKGLISSSQQFTSLTAPFTGSFTGSFRGALTHFNPSTLKLTVGTTAPASPAVNDLWVDTN